MSIESCSTPPRKVMPMSYPTDLQRVAIYLRKSRADIEAEARGEGETLSKHRRALLALAKKHQYGIDDLYEEIVSGERIVDRPEVQKMLHAVRSSSYTAVLCMDIDRLGRGNMMDQGIIQDSFKASKTLIITPRKVYDLQDELDEEWSEFEAFMARRELKIITRRMQRGRKMSAQDGKYIGKKPPFGYTLDATMHMVPIPEQADVVKLIFTLRTEGLGRVAIANRLTDMRIPTPKGDSVWASPTVRDMLINEAYIGRLVWCQYKHYKDDLGHARTKRLPRDEWIVVEDAHPAIIDASLWDAVQKMNKAKSHHGAKDYALKNAMAGLLRCNACGKVMVRRNHHGRPRGMLLCLTHGCDVNMIARYDYVEEALIDRLRLMVETHRLQNQPKRKKQTQVRDNDLSLLGRSLVAIESEIEKLHTQKSSLHDLLEQKVYDIQMFMDRSRVLDDRIQSLQVNLSKTRIKLDMARAQVHTRASIIPSIEHVLSLWDSLDTAQDKNDLLKTIIEEVQYSRPKEQASRDDHKSFELAVYLRT